MTKRQKLLKELKLYAKQSGQKMVTTEGGRHTKIVIGEKTTFVPRHNEIGESLAREIRKQIGVEK